MDPTIAQTADGARLRVGNLDDPCTSHPTWSATLSAIEPVSAAMPFEPATQGWITRERSGPGHIGDPRHATALKGRDALSHFLP